MQGSTFIPCDRIQILSRQHLCTPLAFLARTWRSFPCDFHLLGCILCFNSSKTFSKVVRCLLEAARQWNQFVIKPNKNKSQNCLTLLVFNTTLLNQKSTKMFYLSTLNYRILSHVCRANSNSMLLVIEHLCLIAVHFISSNSVSQSTHWH